MRIDHTEGPPGAPGGLGRDYQHSVNIFDLHRLVGINIDDLFHGQLGRFRRLSRLMNRLPSTNRRFGRSLYDWEHAADRITHRQERP
jgi:hypothetical protein